MLFIVFLCFLELLIKGTITVAANDCNATIASFPAQGKLQLLWPRFINREASPNFQGNRIKRNDEYFAYIEKGSSYGQCLKDIVDVDLKKFCLQKVQFSKVNNTYLMLQISSPNVSDSACYAVEWMFLNGESKDLEKIYLDVNEGSPTTQPTTTVSAPNKDDVSHKPSSPSPAPAAASDASYMYSAIKQTLYLYCLLLVTVP